MKYGIEVRSVFWSLSNLRKYSSKYLGKEKESRNILPWKQTSVGPSQVYLLWAQGRLQGLSYF